MRRILLYTLFLGVCGSPAIGQVNLPEGFEVVEIGTSDHFAGFPAINNCGQIIFAKQLGPRFDDKEMFLYDNGGLKQLTDDGVSDRVPDINDAGIAVWMRKSLNGTDTQIVLYADGELSIFDEWELGVLSASINNSGHIAWGLWRQTRCPYRTDLMLWDGNTVRRISDNKPFLNQSPDLNERGDVVWGRGDFCVNPWVADIMFYSEGKRQVLPSQFDQLSNAMINSTRQIAWTNPGGIEVWDAGETRLLTDWGDVPELNDRGDIGFFRWHNDIRTDQKWMFRVGDGGPQFHRLTADRRTHTAGDINDWAELVWRYSKRPRRLQGGWLFLRRIRTGDSEFDEDVDLVDYAAFADCMTGPGRVDRLCDCRFLDVDHDGDVDLGDFALFQNAFTGEK